MAWRITIWCNDCTGTDPDGCFGGGTEIIVVDPLTSGPIETLERANEIASDFIGDCGPWDYSCKEIGETPATRQEEVV